MPKELVYYEGGSFKSVPYSATSGGTNDNTAVSVAELNKKAPRTVELTGTLLASGWGSGLYPPFTQTLTINGISASTKGIVSLSQSATSAQYQITAKAMLRPSAQGTNTITIVAEGYKPTVDLPIVISISE